MKKLIITLFACLAGLAAANAETFTYPVYLYRVGTTYRGIANATWGKVQKIDGTITFTESEVIFSYPEERSYTRYSGNDIWRNERNGWKSLRMQVRNDELGHTHTMLLRKNEKDQLTEVYIVRGSGTYAYGIKTDASIEESTGKLGNF